MSEIQPHELEPKDFPPLKNDLILRVLKGEQVERVPVWIMRQAGRYLPEFRETRTMHEFFKVCRTPELACKVTLQPIDRYKELLDASIIFSDILVVPQALGLVVEMVPGKGPHFPEPLIDPSHLSRINKDVDVSKELDYVYKAITLTRHRLDGRVPLFGFAGSPWTLMAYMIEGGGSKNLSKAKTWLGKYKKESHQLLRILTDTIAEYVAYQCLGGAQLIQIFDSWGGDLSPEFFEEFSAPYLLEIPKLARNILINKLNRPDLAENIPFLAFPKGAHESIELFCKSQCEYNGVSVDWSMNPKRIRERVDIKDNNERKTILQGNLDPCILYANDDVIRSSTEKMLKQFGTKSHHIANLGHGMLPDHTPEKLKVYLESIRDVSIKLNK